MSMYIKTQSRAELSSSVVSSGHVLLFSEDGSTLTAKKPDGTFTQIGGDSSGGTAVVVDTELSNTSTNPVQNKVVVSALDGKADSYHTHMVSHITGLSEDLSDKADANAFSAVSSTVNTLSSTVAGKLDNPSGGSAGQVLTKTSGGVQWATPATGGLDSAGVLSTVSSAGYITSSAVNNKLDMYVLQSTYGMEVNTLRLGLDSKANTTEVYTKTEIDAKFGTFETQANAVIGGD